MTWAAALVIGYAVWALYAMFGGTKDHRSRAMSWWRIRGYAGLLYLAAGAVAVLAFVTRHIMLAVGAAGAFVVLRQVLRYAVGRFAYHDMVTRLQDAAPASLRGSSAAARAVAARIVFSARGRR